MDRIEKDAIHQMVIKHQKEALEFLVEVIQTPSVSGEEQEVSKVYKKWIEKAGLQVEVHGLREERPNLLSYWRGAEEGPCFVFNGHYDVFPPLDNDLGRYGPWSAHIEDGCIYGRGTVDMKSGLCASIMAVTLLKKMGFVPRGTVTLSCDCDEEIGGKYGVEYLLKQNLLQGDFGVCMEPTQSKIMVEGGGGIFMQVTYHSPTWHGGVQMKRKDALQKAIQAIQCLYDLDEKLRKEKYYAPFAGGAFLSITEIQAGEMMNMHPASCTFTIDRRIIPGETPKAAEQEIIAVLEMLKQQDYTMEYTTRLLSQMPALKVNEDDPLIEAAFSAYHTVYGTETELYRRPGGSDSAKIVEHYGYCMPNFGPGRDTTETTSPNEHLPLQEYFDFIEIYMHMVVNLLGKQ